MKYNLDNKPGVLPMILYSLQWFIVTVPILVIIGVVAAGIHTTDPVAQIVYLQKLFAITGILSVVQVLWGHRLPLIVGPATVLLIGVISTVSTGAAATYTAIMIGGCILSVLAFSGALGKIRLIFTPRVITVILIMIALTLTPVILNLITSNSSSMSFNLAFALILTAILVVLNRILKGIWKSTTLVWGLLMGSIIYYLINGFPIATNTNTPVFGFEDSSFFINFEFNIGTILAFQFCFIALIINELGSIESIAQMLNADNTTGRIKRGVGILGLSNMLSGSMGIVGSVDFTMSTGIISATQCASRYTLIPAGIGLLVCAFFPPIINLLSSVPHVVLGCIMLYLMSTQFASGLMMIGSVKAIRNFDHALTVGLSLMVALIISFAPEETFSMFPVILHPIIGNGFVMGVITVLLLEHVLFREKS